MHHQGSCTVRRWFLCTGVKDLLTPRRRGTPCPHSGQRTSSVRYCTSKQARSISRHYHTLGACRHCRFCHCCPPYLRTKPVPVVGGPVALAVPQPREYIQFRAKPQLVQLLLGACGASSAKSHNNGEGDTGCATGLGKTQKHTTIVTVLESCSRAGEHPAPGCSNRPVETPLQHTDTCTLTASCYRKPVQ